MKRAFALLLIIATHGVAVAEKPCKEFTKAEADLVAAQKDLFNCLKAAKGKSEACNAQGQRVVELTKKLKRGTDEVCKPKPVLCGDPSLPADDPSDPDYHRYELHSEPICNPAELPGCSVDRVFQIMLDTPAAVAPLRKGVGEQHVKDCGVLLLATFPANYGGYDNRIRMVIDAKGRSVTNITLEKHLLYPGRVVRQVILEDGVVKVVTIGTGSDKGWKKDLNLDTAPFIWQDADEALKDAVQKELGRTP